MDIKRFQVYLVNLDPTRVQCSFQDKKGQIVLDQVRTVDKKRLVKKLGTINAKAQNSVLNLLQELFAK